MRKDDNGLTAEDRDREAQAQRLIEFKRNLPHRAPICPQTRVRCACPASCDPPYDCMSAELEYIKEAQIARVQALKARTPGDRYTMTGLFIIAFLAFLLLVKVLR